MAYTHRIRLWLGLLWWQRHVRQWIMIAVAVLFTHSVPCAALLGSPSFIPANQSSDVPLQAFTILLTFQETVQAGVGTIIVRTTSNDQVVNLGCSSDPKYVANSVLVPITTELVSDTLHTLQIPSSCFLNAASETLAAAIDDYAFRTSVKGANVYANDFISPTGLPVVQPAPSSWLEAGPKARSFTFYFSEAVQKGDSSVVVSQLVRGSIDTWNTFDAEPTIAFTAFPGEVIVTSQKSLETGAEYELSFRNDAFRDIAGNYMPRSAVSLAYSPYRVRVSATIDSAKALVTDALVPSSNFVFHFTDRVMSGTEGEVSICQGWSSSTPCMSPVPVPLSRILFLGTIVVINPAADLEKSGQYNMSIPDTVISVFRGMEIGALTFTVNATPEADVRCPGLVALRVDCNEDGDITDSSGQSDVCDADGDGLDEFYEVSGTLDADKPMRVGARFLMIFDERVRISDGGVAALHGDDGHSTTVENVIPEIGDAVMDLTPKFAQDTTVQLHPESLMSGKLYTLSIAPDVITDTSSIGNGYMGTSISFYTPMRTPTSYPQHGAENVASTTAIKLTFLGRPQIGSSSLTSEENLKISVKDVGTNAVRHIPLSDPDQVKFLERDVIILPRPPLSAGAKYHITLPRQSIRYMTADFSLEFSTRVEDQRSPVILIHYPRGEIMTSDSTDAAPWFLFSEGVSPVAGKSIVFKENGITKYTIRSNDDTCGSGGTPNDACAVLDSDRRKLTLYPLGQRSPPAAWATSGAVYTVEFEDGSFSDAWTTGLALANPMRSATFTLSGQASVVQSPLVVSSDNSTQQLRFASFLPAKDARRVSVSSDITIGFVEAIQRGTAIGFARFCVNQDAALDGNPPCNPGKFKDGRPAEFEISSAIFAAREIVFQTNREFAASQALYLLLPADVAKDASTGTIGSPALQASDYGFRIEDEDTVQPFLSYYEPPVVTTGQLRLFFSEAIQAAGTPVQVVDANTQALVPGVQSKISGNMLILTKDPWEAGAEYKLEAVDDALKDLAGNVFMGRYAYNGAGYTMVEEPNATVCESSRARRLLSSTEDDDNSTSNGTDESHDSQSAEESSALDDCDYTRPTILRLSPAEGAFRFPLNLSSTGVVVGVFFSEPVRMVGDVSVFNELGATSERPPYLIDGDGIAFPIAHDLLLPGIMFTISFPDGAIVDAAGNALEATNKSFTGFPVPTQVTLSSVMFSIDSDTANPTATLKAAPSIAEFPQYGQIMLEFNEVVQKGTGKVTINYRDPPDCEDEACQKQLMQAEVSSLPLLTSSSSGSLASLAFIDPGEKLEPGFNFTLTVPPTAFTDLAGNAFAGFEDSQSTISTLMLKDITKPVLLAVDMGLGNTPNPNYVAGTPIKLYFSEAVQLTSIGSAILVGTDGGNFCSSSHKGGCLQPDESCLSPCGYVPASTGDMASPRSRTVNGAVVELDDFAGLITGKGYKLFVDAGFITDMAGNAIDAIDGDLNGHVLSRTLLNIVPTPPKLVETWPLTNAELLPLNTMVRLTFDSAIQMGTGSVQIGSHSVPVQSCHMQQFSLICIPPQRLEAGSTYTVVLSTNAIKGLTGTPAMAPSFQFTTMDREYISQATLVAPLDNETVVAKGQVVTLSFSQSIQVGVGNIIISGCTANSETITVSPLTPGYQLYFDEGKVHVEQDADCLEGAMYSVTTDRAGVFKDSTSTPLSKVGDDLTFNVVPTDKIDPQVYQSYPPSSSAGLRVAPNAAVQLYFSEAVQQSTGVATATVNGVIALECVTTVTGNIVTLHPPHVGYSRSSIPVEITVPNNAFTDLSGRAFAGWSGSFEVEPFNFAQVKVNNQSIPFPPREGPVMYHINSTLVMFGGKDQDGCKNDLWHSATGVAWELVNTSLFNTSSMTEAMPAPKVAYARTAMDKNECIWLLGGECNDDFANLLKTCNAGRSWQQLPVPSIVPMNNQPLLSWPQAWSGHAITIVGGWQLVIVDSANTVDGCVWKSLVANAEFMQCVLSVPFPFSPRRDPALMSTSANELMLVGGHNCNNVLCSNNMVLSDIWKSSDMGASWQCQTVHYAPINPEVVSQYSAGIGRYASIVMLNDDTIYLMAGMRANSTRGSNLVLVSSQPDADTDFAGSSTLISAALLQHPRNNADDVPRIGTVPALYFKEYVQRGPGNIVLENHGMAPPTEVHVTVSIVGQKVMLTPAATLQAGKLYGIRVSPGALTDLAGNSLATEVVSYFRTTRDVQAPTILSILPDNAGADVSLQTTFAITCSDPVILGVGDFVLYQQSLGIGSGETINISASELFITGTQVLFSLPKGTQLLPSTTYKWQLPTGFLTDVVGNEMLATSSLFTTGNNVSMTVPQILAALPRVDQEDFPPGSTHMEFYFSQTIEAGTGSIRIADMTGNFDDVLLSIGSASILGGKLSVPIPTGALRPYGLYEVIMPVGFVKGWSGQPFTGESASDYVFRFYTSSADLVAPVLSQQSPPHEPTPTFTLPTSSPILLTFNEAVQAGASIGISSEIILSPLHHAGNLTVSAQNESQVVIEGSQVLVLPPEELMPGEIYRIIIGSSAFKDLASNFFAGLGAGYAISTAPRIKFLQALDGHWSENSGLDSQFNGERYGMGTAITSDNQVFVAGGRRGDGQVNELLNDVWTLDTKHETHCAAALPADVPCSQSTCQLDSNGSPTLGTRELKLTIWRVPSVGGIACQAADGMARSAMGEVLQSSTEVCQCPICLSPPAGVLPTHMANTDYINSYKDLIANHTSRPLLCETGYVATGPFVCISENPFLGSFQQPYPECLPAPCVEPPAVGSTPEFGKYVLNSSTGSLNCSTLSPSSPMNHSGQCGIACKPGWRSPTGNVTCIKGEFTEHACEKQMCLKSGAVFEHAVPSCGEEDSVPFGQTCETFCEPGYKLFTQAPLAQDVEVASILLECLATSMEVEAAPLLQYPASGGVATCRKNVCDAPYSGKQDGATITYPSDRSLGSVATITCALGYVPDGVNQLDCLPTSDTPGNSSVAWRNASGTKPNNLCRKLECTPPVDGNGYYEHINGTGITAWWELICDPGYKTPSRDPYARCSSDGETSVLEQPKACIFTGGCNATSMQVEGTSANGTTCPDWMDEGDTCSVTCTAGTPVGLFTCVVMEVAGLSQCAEEGAETNSVTMVTGSFSMSVQVPQGTNIQSTPFLDMMKGALSEGLGLWPADFSKFVVKPASNQDRRLGSPRRLGEPRRLEIKAFEVSYEIMVRDLGNLGNLLQSLGALESTDSIVYQSFSRTLLANGCQVLSLAIQRPPKAFQGTVLVPDTTGSSALSRTEEVDTALNTSTIAGGFIGAMMGLTLVTAFIYIITRARRKKGRG